IALRREVQSPRGVRFLAVIGPSGSGKSSVVRAGLVRSLKDGSIEGSKTWPIAILEPGHNPLESLARAIVIGLDPAAGRQDIQKDLQHDAAVEELARRLDEDRERLAKFARTALHGKPEEVRLLVVVDQFEEVFTYRPQDEPTKKRFE